ncbi:hypothetical protein F1559_004724 [Cyanidiococcus yangmingshanensis]|uniref:Uncharacterized protein n=1 Tax=Cyanidiococcus yangmingshanensis TaxID=2690220 RepID=A0A7J7IP26_9RHOD|nr:hypothetical protein F1559_004724 [Cyanidiococcus yangmingshanensis]
MRYLRATAQTLKLIKAGCLRRPRWMQALEGLAPVRAQQERYRDVESVSNRVRTLPVSESSVRKKLLRQLRRRLAVRHPEWLGHVVVDLSVKSRSERDFMEKFVHKQAELILTQRVSEDEAYQRTLALLKSELPGVHHSVAVSDERAQDLGEMARSSTLFEQLVIPKTSTERTGKGPEEVFRASWIDAQRDRWLFDQIHRRSVR